MGTSAGRFHAVRGASLPISLMVAIRGFPCLRRRAQLLQGPLETRSDRANQPFSICVPRWRLRCSWSMANIHRTNSPDACLAKSAVVIANDKAFQPREGPCLPGPSTWQRASGDIDAKLEQFAVDAGCTP